MNNLHTRPILGNGLSQHQKMNQLKFNYEIFNFQCKISANGKITQKEEITPLGKAVYQYSYDSKGHLIEVVRNGKLIEKYEYNQEGQRTEDYRTAFNGSRQFIYGYDGALIRVNDAYLEWTPQGQLKAIYSHQQRAEYEYGDDSRLDKVYLPSGNMIQYEYSKELMPVKVLDGYEPAFEYTWKDSLQLQRCVDIQNEVSYVFSYGKNRLPETVSIQGNPESIQRLTAQYTSNLNLQIWVDQVGSIRALSSSSGAVIKYLEYDAFGNVTLDTKPELNFPLGFAGGLNDIYTGFVRFGFRDYDPQVGRFTAKDPIGDTGGDHDLWDYCVDDPVSINDPTGLWPPLLVLAAGIAGSLGLGVGGSYGAAKIADSIKTNQEGMESSAGRDAVLKVTPKVINTHRAAFLPGELAAGAAVGKLGQTLLTKSFLEFFLKGKGDSSQQNE